MVGFCYTWIMMNPEEAPSYTPQDPVHLDEGDQAIEQSMRAYVGSGHIASKEKAAPAFFTVRNETHPHSAYEADWGLVVKNEVEKAVDFFESLGAPSHTKQYRNTEDTYLPIYQTAPPEKLRAVQEVISTARARGETRSRKSFHENKEHGVLSQVAEILPLIANEIDVFGKGVRIEVSHTAKSEDEAGAFADLAVQLDIADAWRKAAETPGHPMKEYTNELNRLPKYFVFDVTTKTDTDEKVRDRGRSLKESGGRFADLYFYWRKKPGMQGPPRLSELGIPEAPKLILKSDPDSLLSFLRNVQPTIEIKGDRSSISNFKDFEEEYKDFFVGDEMHPGAAYRLLEDATLLLRQTAIQFSSEGYIKEADLALFAEPERYAPVDFHKKVGRIRIHPPEPQRERTLRKLSELKLTLHFILENAKLEEPAQ